MGSELVELFIVSKFLNIFDSIGLIYHRGMFQFLQDRRTSICSQFTSAATVEVPPDNQLLTTVRMRQLNDRNAGKGTGLYMPAAVVLEAVGSTGAFRTGIYSPVPFPASLSLSVPHQYE